MKKMNWITISAVAVLATAALLGANGARPEPTRAGVCDIQKAVTSYRRFVDTTNRLEVQERAFKAEATRQADLVQQMLDQLKSLRKGTPDYVRLEEKSWEEMYKTQTYQTSQQGKLERDRRNGVMEAYNDIVAEVGAYARENGIDIVHYVGDIPLDRARDVAELESLINSRRVLYSDPRIDLTDAVMARLNARYQTANPAPAPPTAPVPPPAPATTAAPLPMPGR